MQAHIRASVQLRAKINKLKNGSYIVKINKVKGNCSNRLRTGVKFKAGVGVLRIN